MILRGVSMLGERLKYYRKQSNKTLEQLAEEIGVSLGFLQTMEAGKRLPSIELLYRIADVLNVCPSLLLSDDDLEIPVIKELEHYSHNDLKIATSVTMTLVSELNRDKSDSALNIGNRILKFRLDAGLSRKEVASQIDLTVDGLRRIETGINATTIKTLDAIMQIFDLPIDYAIQDNCKAASVYILSNMLTNAKATLTSEQYQKLSNILQEFLPGFDDNTAIK